MFFLILLNSFLLVAGQVLWKLGMSKIELNSFIDLFKALFSSYILYGFLAYAAATVLWLYILNKSELSHAFTIVQGATLLFILICGIALFKETVSINKIISVILILIGLYIGK